jgi:hypothetical protein
LPAACCCWPATRCCRARGIPLLLLYVRCIPLLPLAHHSLLPTATTDCLLLAACCRPLPTARCHPPRLLSAATACTLQPAVATCKVQIQQSSVTEGGGTQLLAKSKSNQVQSQREEAHTCTGTLALDRLRALIDTDHPRAQTALGHYHSTALWHYQSRCPTYPPLVF